MNHSDYLEAGFRIMAIHPVDKDGLCGCGNPDCKAILKHPKASNWQHTPHWSEEQIDNMEKFGQLDQAFGVLVDDHLIVDVDPRNGGDVALAQLQEDIGLNLEAESEFVVETGGGGLHIYFKRDPSTPLVSHLRQYEGIDFKSSGYVIGCGSLHASGGVYEAKKGYPHDQAPIPEVLLELLKKKDTYRASYNGKPLDVTDSDLEKMLGCYKNNDLDYEDWIRCGMALHHATNGSGFELWDRWSQSSGKYEPSMMEKKWHSFGKSSNPVTIGTLIYHAEQNGYRQPVTFESDINYENAAPVVDLLRPPGFIGDITQWINSQCRFPRERLAVAAALSAVGNIAGLRYEDELYGVTTNQFMFCVAGSATGKEAVQQAQIEIHKAAGMMPATHGGIKSEQEILRNLVTHQAALYIVDEMGLLLQKIKNARARGGAAYLEGVIGTLMSSYSKANGLMPVSGDLRQDIELKLQNQIAKLRRREETEGENHGEEIAALEKQMLSAREGIDKPFVSLIGYTTPVTFNDLMDYEQSANGFFGRAIVVQEKDTNPRAKKKFKPEDMPDEMRMMLASLASSGDTGKGRIEIKGNRKKIPTDPGAEARLDQIQDELFDHADRSKETTLEALPRRAFELVLKVSLVLALPSGIRTLEHVEWANAFVKRDIDEKMNLVAGNMAATDKRNDEALMRRIIGMLDEESPEGQGVIINRCRPHSKADVLKALDALEDKGIIKSEEKV